MCASFWGGSTWEIHTFVVTEKLPAWAQCPENGSLHSGLEIRGPSRAGMGAADFSGSFCIGILCTS